MPLLIWGYVRTATRCMYAGRALHARAAATAWRRATWMHGAVRPAKWAAQARVCSLASMHQRNRNVRHVPCFAVLSRCPKLPNLPLIGKGPAKKALPTFQVCRSVAALSHAIRCKWPGSLHEVACVGTDGCQPSRCAMRTCMATWMPCTRMMTCHMAATCTALCPRGAWHRGLHDACACTHVPALAHVPRLYMCPHSTHASVRVPNVFCLCSAPPPPATLTCAPTPTPTLMNVQPPVGAAPAHTQVRVGTAGEIEVLA